MLSAVVEDDMFYLNYLRLNKPSATDYMHVGMDDERLQIFMDALCSNTNLTSLNLSWNCIGDDGAERIAKWLVKHPHVVAIDLKQNGIEIDGAEFLDAVIMMPESHVIYADYECMSGSVKTELGRRCVYVESLTTKYHSKLDFALSDLALFFEWKNSIHFMSERTKDAALIGFDSGIKKMAYHLHFLYTQVFDTYQVPREVAMIVFQCNIDWYIPITLGIKEINEHEQSLMH